MRGPDGLTIRLRPKTFELLKFIAANNNRIIGKQELMEAVWPGIFVSEDSLFQCIRELRNALSDTQRDMIKVVSGRGYLFAVDVSEGPEILGSAWPLEAPTADTIPKAEFAPPAPSPRISKAVIFGTLAILVVVFSALAWPAIFHRFGKASAPIQPSIELLPIVSTATDAQGNDIAQGISAELINGLAKIDGIRVIAPDKQEAPATTEAVVDRPSNADFMLQGELQKSSKTWIFQARLINVTTREVETVADVTLDSNEPDTQRLISRLAAGAGYPLAVRLNKLAGYASASTSSAAGVAIEQATASINQTSKERFATAKTILEKNLGAEPDNVDLQIALANLHLRGIQMSWYGPDDSKTAENDARSLLERALQSRPNSIPVLGTYCRLLTVTNQFTDSLVACGRALNLNPWDGTALFHLGLTQLQLGRFADALGTFEQADRFDTPDVSRWTWLLGAGWADVLLGHDEDAIGWLQRSIAITPASGRVYMLLAVAYQRSGHTVEAKQTMAKAMELRPGSTTANISLPSRNTSPIYLEERGKINQVLIELGLPTGDAAQK
nr:winged helix-turn-helix domain-containing protein [Rhizobium sp. P38BS-XIX]